MKYELTLDQWLQLHTLIGFTQGSLTAVSAQCKHDEFFKYMCTSLDKLNEDWDEFVKTLKEAQKVTEKDAQG